ncbi:MULTISPECIES: RNA ligase RtcB family protein [unclassified Chelatococcus]|uniref:RNA ligase RtcB family protein n=1 Tax=unclassified Chelatococcus TaxID=2638111 RepID=UPI001BCA71F0|nr:MULTISPECIES: RNA ligase RtcB family protein [unclassified Chelatococcus]MBS7696450.1 RNA ligase RtcB family protein [Chelatococcus sp. YT9]MBX3557060.1 RNA ligase RtcB family protein [Chelatococcus sp.]
MGTSFYAAADARVRIFASSTSWIEGAAVRQLEQTAERNGVIAVAGMPDLHPGHHGPVGCAVLAEGIVYPDIIGTDIGCGMQLWSLDLTERRLKIDKAAERFAAIEGPWPGDARDLVAKEGIDDGGFADSLGTVGGGNHFCELQAVAEIVDPERARGAGIEAGALALLIHSGSRGLGAAVLADHHAGGTEGLPLSAGGEAYLAAHDNAVAFARLNRRVIATRAMAALRCDGALTVDSPHNLAEQVDHKVLHRKGAAPADRGLVPVPGSRGALTYLVAPLPPPAGAITSIAHGAGRRHDRASMEGRVRKQQGDLARLTRNAFGGRILCSDRRLLVEEAPEAYKNIEHVIDDMVRHAMVSVVAVLRPVITFKTLREARPRNGRAS